MILNKGAKLYWHNTSREATIKNCTIYTHVSMYIYTKSRFCVVSGSITLEHWNKSYLVLVYGLRFTIHYLNCKVYQYLAVIKNAMHEVRASE